MNNNVIRVDLDALLDLRERALVPGHPGRPLITPYDDAAEHYAVVRDDRPIACASVSREQMPGIDSAHPFYLHAMAVEPELQGAGHGQRLLESIVGTLRTRGADLIWARARPTAVGFYQRFGFQLGDSVVVQPTGAVMRCVWMRLEAPSVTAVEVVRSH